MKKHVQVLIILILIVTFYLYKLSIQQFSNYTENKKEKTVNGSGNFTDNVEMTDLEDYNSIHVIINKKHTLPEDYEPGDLVSPNVMKMKDSCTMREEASKALEKMFEAASDEGLKLLLVSGYRSYSYQKGLFDIYTARDGEEAANRYSAKAGQSEHQTGLAVDLGAADQACLLKECFKDSEEGKWLKENSYLFGFILRYPQEKEEITGYVYEPWHFRYIGLQEAYLVHESGLTLEEYYDYCN